MKTNSHDNTILQVIKSKEHRESQIQFTELYEVVKNFQYLLKFIRKCFKNYCFSTHLFNPFVMYHKSYSIPNQHLKASLTGPKKNNNNNMRN